MAGLGVPSASRRTRARRLADQLLTTLERQIDEGRIRPGERLATERELALQFGASRNVVRTALAELHRVGKIARRVGHGTIVTAPGEQRRSALAFLDASPMELLEFRLAVEPGLAEAITLHASERDLAAIGKCVDGGDGASRVEEWEHWDRSFHHLLVAATHNRLATAVYEAVTAVRHERPWLRLDQEHTDAARWRVYQSDHRAIAEALFARDAAAAGAAIRCHLLKVRASMLGQ
ncbi:MAG: FadR family transcriptional regulator [Alphaproteobacteria bacterium]|nr:FadR family transcriptional regulator [Alphaproteobacteria bacterium]